VCGACSDVSRAQVCMTSIYTILSCLFTSKIHA
jgi:hypothetical protein